MSEQGLKALIRAGRVVSTSDGDFTVRGIGLETILAIFERHRGETSAWFEKLATEGDGNIGLSLEQTREIGTKLLSGQATAAIVAEIIAAGAGPVDDETIAIARSLAFPAQLDALVKIAELTFTSDMPPKKVIEIVIRAMSGTTNVLLDLRA